MSELSFSPKAISKELLVGLSDRSRHVLTDRFGLSGKGEQRTLDAIGREYGITRERVRQIENHALAAVRDSDAYREQIALLDELKREVHALGGILSEESILAELARNTAERNHLLFLLTIGHHFDDRRENTDFHVRWHVDETIADMVEGALSNLHESLASDTLIPEEEFLQLFAKYLKAAGVKNKSDEILGRWLAMSKRVGKNPLGEWGRMDSPHVRIKNTRDFAYLTIKRHGSPMHFTEVAHGIEKLFKRKTHPATTHNELIKDTRFVLVGRGLYALKEWGYEPGIVRDVIRNIIEREGPLSREDIIERVKRERYVKDATIAVNLQAGIFTRLPDGRYTIEMSKK
jgi:hypothetical protein